MTKPSNPAPQGGPLEADPVQGSPQESKPASEQKAPNGESTDKPQAGAAAEPEVKADAQAEAKTDAQPVAKADAAPATKAPESAKPDTKAQDEARKAELAKQKEKDKEEADRRAKVQEAVKVSPPVATPSPAKPFEQPGVGKHTFADPSQSDIFPNDVKLVDAKDFYDLDAAQRENLLGRIGFYNGIVIDHDLPNPVKTAFMEVLQRKASQADPAAAGPNAGVTALPQLPEFSGYYENYYTSSESMHQVQKNGLADIKSSLNVVGGKAVSVGVGVSGAYYDSQASSEGAIKKKLYITTNYFLPKIELSFDDSSPCASAAFEAACSKALTAGLEESCFTALLSVLGRFGQFVSTQTLVGGRLFATDVKEYAGNESETEAKNRYAAQLKVGAKSVTASFDSDTSVERSNETRTRGVDKDEEQSRTIQAVGGDGAVLQNAGQWAQSLANYQKWAAVQREKLVPSIDMLSEKLRSDAWDLLKAFAKKNSAMQLIARYKAYFLFYGKYDTEVGRLSRSDIVILKNLNSQNYLAMVGETPENGNLAGKPFDWAYQYLWRLTPNGNIVSAIPVSTGSPGDADTVDFALTVIDSKLPKDATSPATLNVGLRELGTASNQTWELTARGQIRTRAFGNTYLLAMPLDDKPVLRLDAGNDDPATFWSRQAAMPADIDKIASRKVFGKLRHRSGLVLAIDGCEDNTKSFVLADGRRVLLQPDNGGKHQLWHRREDGVIVSALSISSDPASAPGDVYLVRLADESIGVQAQNDMTKVGKIDEQGLACMPDGAHLPSYFSAQVAANVSGQGLRLDHDKSDALTFEQLPAGVRPITYMVVVPRNLTPACERLKTVDKRPLIVDGFLTGIEFILEKRGKGRISYDEYSRLRMRLSVARDDGAAPPVELADEPDDDAVDRDFLCDDDGNSNVDVDTRFLLLPEGRIHAIRLSTHGASSRRRLAFDYQRVEDGPWIGLSDDTKGAKPLDVHGIATGDSADTGAANATKVLGVGLAYDTTNKSLKPKLLRRLLG